MGNIVDVEKLIQAAKNKTSARYIHRKGKRIKVLEYQFLDPQVKEELNIKDDIDWTAIDKELDKLNEQWRNSKNKREKEILFIKYDLALENFVKINPHKIIELTNKLNKLIEGNSSK